MSHDALPASALTLYDIKTAPPVEQTCCSPNPWKARFALNFKSAPYSTSWVDLPNVSRVRQGLNVPAGRKFGDGTDYYTLPILQDHETGSLVGDSFDIAVYLQKKYPNDGAGDLFPAQKLDFVYEREILVPLSKIESEEFPEYAKFNTNVDCVFTAFVAITMERFPFDPETADLSKAEFVRRASSYGITSWEGMMVSKDAREATLQSMETALAELAVLFRRNGGPFLQGSKPNYADLMVGSWLKMYSRSLPEKEWERVKSWHDGIFGRLHDALEVFTQVI